MSHPTSQRRSDSAAGSPRYEQTGSADELRAIFDSDVTVRVPRGRVRAYPKLPSSAPKTETFYRALVAAVPTAKRALDVGCGAAVGTRHLVEAHESVVGVDCDPDAIDFARAYEPRAEYLVSDLASAPPLDDADAVLIADVLGHAIDYESVLRSVRKRTATGARVLVAEPAAYPAQSLEAPARRAFSRSSLEAALETCGFEVVTWADAQHSFVVCVAVPSPDEGWLHLERAAVCAGTGDVDATLNALAQAARSSRLPVQIQAALHDGDAQIALGNGDAAARAFFRARELAPEDPRPTAGVARLSLAAGSLSDAVELATSAVTACPTDFDCACTLALVLAEAHPSAALESLRMANALRPADEAVAVELAKASRQLGDAELGIWGLDRVRAFGDELSPATHLLFAELLAEAGRHADAEIETRLAQATSASSGEPR